MIKNLFENLSNFYCLENDLSNITKIMCDVSPFFKKLFINFFFPELDVKKVESIDREITAPNNAGSRVDLYLSVYEDDLPYLIEVKIGDTNHHFGQYEKDYNIPSERLGYITNYTCIQPGYKVKTWEEFYDLLNKNLGKIRNEMEKELCNGYLHYLMSSCNFIKLEGPMNFNTLQSLYQFFIVLRPLMKIESSELSMEPSKFYAPVSNGLPVGIQLIDYYLTPKRKKKPYYGWIAFYYNQEQPLVTMFLDNVEKRIDELINRIDEFKAGKYYNKPYIGNDEQWNRFGIWFDMKDSVFNKISSTDKLENQSKILQNFIIEVAQFIVSQTTNKSE